jgi:hypothetical protein
MQKTCSIAVGIPCSLKIRISRLAKQNGMSVCELVELGLRLYLVELENGGALKTGRADDVVAVGNNRGKRCRNASFLLCRRAMKRRRSGV